ncbi:hypothetical protein RHSIM_Rhsim09G0182500 [Rhododendron simsii]|uniref:Uncharacterized protein n=1 Tax=Rhododendron simsii TaxID=118357 RepID=A0A834GFF9_RHOSS|nr:hypothetical protein RHSIM_Rhsim09G0182500 [Rhododendron simsii]
MISNKTNHQIHQKRDFATRLSDDVDDKGICFSNSQSSFTFESILRATIKDPNQHSEILDMAKFAVNEHNNNNNNAEGVEKGNNLLLDKVVEAHLGFKLGVAEFDMTLRASDEGSVDGGGGLNRVYKATVSKSRTGDLALRDFAQSEPVDGSTSSPPEKKKREKPIPKRNEDFPQDPDDQLYGEILDIAKLAVNEHNNNLSKAQRKRQLELVRVLEANLKFNPGETEFKIKLQTKGGNWHKHEATVFKSRTGGLKFGNIVRVYEATVFKSKTGGLKLGHFEWRDPFKGLRLLKEEDRYLHPGFCYPGNQDLAWRATLCSDTQN